tara:strand:- start:186 stop:692 length:507 start_codon:yes stop_codon:yes gene_type:complete
MRIFLFFILSFLLWSCSTVEVTKEVIKVTNTVTDKVKDSVLQKKEGTESVVGDIVEEKEIEEEIEIIEEKKELEKNIIENQQKVADTNFIGKSEDIIFQLLGEAQLSRIDGSVYTLRYDGDNCRLFIFFNQETNIKRVEYFELRNNKAELLNSKDSLESCYKEFGLFN